MSLRKRLVAALFAALLIPAAFAAPAFAYYVEIEPGGVSCGSWEGWPKICFWEDGIGQGDKLIVWQNSSGQFVDLDDRAHLLSGQCNATFKVGDDWNDCITSGRWYGDNGTAGEIADWLCVYRDASYSHAGGAWYSFKGTWPAAAYDDFSLEAVGVGNDAMSSFKIHRDYGNSNPC